MIEYFKAVDLVTKLADTITTGIAKFSLSKPTDSARYATPIYITFLLLELITDTVIEDLTIAKKALTTEKTSDRLSIAQTYFNNSAADLKVLERVLNEFSIWLSTSQASSLFNYPITVKEFVDYLVGINFPSEQESKNPDFDIKLLRYGDSPPVVQYANKLVYNFEQLKIGLQANCSILEESHNALTSIKTIKNISIRARMAVAIECILKAAKRLNLQHAELEKFIEFFWSFVEQDDLAGWDFRLRAYDELCEVWDDDYNNKQLSNKVASIPEHIRKMCRYAVELGGWELYGAVQSYSPHTYQYLLDILRILAYTTEEIVEFSAYQKSSFNELYGWGFPHHRSWFTISG